MPKQIKKSKINSLFKYLKGRKSQKEISISAPNNLNDLQTKVLEEVNKKLSIIEELSEKNYDQQHLLALMKAIKKFSEKEKTFENIDILKGMIALYKEKNIDWDSFQPLPSASLVDPIQATPEISLFQQQLQFQATQLKPVKIDSQENAPSTIKQNDQAFFLGLKVDDIARNKLKPVQKSVISNEVEPSELDVLLAKRKAISEETDGFNLDPVISREYLSDEALYDEDRDLSFYERRLKALSTILEEVEQERNSVFFILPNENRANEMSDSFANAESQELLEFIEAEKQIALEENLQKELTEAQQKLEELFQSLIDTNNQNVKSSEIKECISTYFKNSRPHEHISTNIGATLKPNL
jgi:hypothetical protein